MFKLQFNYYLSVSLRVSTKPQFAPSSTYELMKGHLVFIPILTEVTLGTKLGRVHDTQ